jgi:hypothetical protein
MPQRFFVHALARRRRITSGRLSRILDVVLLLYPLALQIVKLVSHV